MRYRFLYRYGNAYVWESTTKLPGDSRVEQVRCNVDWFWGRKKARSISESLQQKP